MSYDTKCYELAKDFLDDTDTQPINSESHRKELAQRIQDVIEDFIQEKRG